MRRDGRAHELDLVGWGQDAVAVDLVGEQADAVLAVHARATERDARRIGGVAEVLVHLVGLAPMKQEYWKQLSSMLLEIKKDPEALATLVLADRRGLIDEEHEFRNLSSMYMFLQIPLKAAQVLERGFAAKKVEPTERNFETLANAWLTAREWEKAEAAMASAAQVSDKGELYKRLGSYPYDQDPSRPGWAPTIPNNRWADHREAVAPEIKY